MCRYAGPLCDLGCSGLQQLAGRAGSGYLSCSQLVLSGLAPTEVYVPRCPATMVCSCGSSFAVLRPRLPHLLLPDEA